MEQPLEYCIILGFQPHVSLLITMFTRLHYSLSETGQLDTRMVGTGVQRTTQTCRREETVLSEVENDLGANTRRIAHAYVRLNPGFGVSYT